MVIIENQPMYCTQALLYSLQKQNSKFGDFIFQCQEQQCGEGGRPKPCNNKPKKQGHKAFRPPKRRGWCIHVRSVASLKTKTGHSQYFGQTYCPNEEGQIPKADWLKLKAEERKAKKNNV